VLVQTPPLLGYIRGRGEVQLQGRWLQDAQELRTDQGIQAAARQTLTPRRALDLLDVEIDMDLFARWQGPAGPAPHQPANGKGHASVARHQNLAEAQPSS
jgi:hypothetical protein